MRGRLHNNFKLFYMAFTQGLQSLNPLLVSQPVTSTVPVTVTGFTKNLIAGNRLYWDIDGLFSIDAVGGWKFLAHATGTVSIYNSKFLILSDVGAAFVAAFTAEAPYESTNAAGTYQLDTSGNIVVSTASVFSFQFAHTVASVDPITMLAGMVIKLWQY